MISSPIGTQGDPLGACITCQSFACGSHGRRDGHVPEFVCVECDPVRFITSAAVTTDETLAGTVTERDERDPARVLMSAGGRGTGRLALA